MGLKKVAVIFDTQKYTAKDIRDEMLAEGFPYEFKMMDDIYLADDPLIYLNEADEVWTFGDVTCEPVFAVARTLGCDIWDMT